MSRIGLFDDDVLLGENDRFQFFENSWTQTLTKEAREMDIHGIELRGWRVIFAQSKTDPNDRNYILIDDKGNARQEDWSVESMSWKIKMFKMNMRDACDIVNMAEESNNARNRMKQSGRRVIA